jgi:hypothetical protein
MRFAGVEPKQGPPGRLLVPRLSRPPGQKKPQFRQRDSEASLSRAGLFSSYPGNYSWPRICLRPPPCPSIFVRCPRGVGGSAGRVHGRTAALRTPAVPAHLKKEEPRAGGGSRLLSLDIFEPGGGVSGDGFAAQPARKLPKVRDSYNHTLAWYDLRVSAEKCRPTPYQPILGRELINARSRRLLSPEERTAQIAAATSAFDPSEISHAQR